MDCKTISIYRNLEIQALNQHKEQKKIKNIETFLLRESFRHEKFSISNNIKPQEKRINLIDLKKLQIDFYA